MLLHHHELQTAHGRQHLILEKQLAGELLSSLYVWPLVGSVQDLEPNSSL